jgi:Rieske 2Fe-2S family protein
MHQKTLKHLALRKPGYTLDHELYCSPETFQDDLEEVFFKEWLFVTPACELPKKGDYVTYNIANYRLIIVRGNDNEVRAFHNSCRHRGSMICREAKGSAAKLVCPYHNWTYDFDGSLVWARDMGDDFNPKDHGLKQVHCQNLSGLIYICLADQAPDIASFAQTLSPYVEPHDLENTKVAYETRVVEEGNWKLVWENNRECYHCLSNHPSLIRTFPEDPRVSFLGDGETPGYIEEHFVKCEAVGLAARFKVPEDGQYRLSRMPLLPGAKSFTMDGNLAVPNKRHVEWDEAGVCNKFHYPSTWAYFLPDHCMTFRVTPISPTETELVTCWLVHKDAQEGVDYDLKHLTEVWEATNDEDRRVVEENQIGVSSPAFTAGPYSPVHELSVDAFVEWYCNKLKDRLGENGLELIASSNGS